MKYQIGLFITAALFLAPSMQAQRTPDSSILYRVTGKTLKKPSYLFGTIHVVCEKDLPFAEKVGTYIGQTEQMMLEIDLDDAKAIKTLTEAATRKDGKSLREHLTAEEFKKLDELYKTYLGFSVELLEHLSPTMVAAYIFTSPKIVGCAQPSRLDQDLAEVAKARNTPIAGLESVTEQLQLVNSTPIAEQIKPLRQFLDNPEKYIQDFRTLYKAYLARDSHALYEIISREFVGQGASKAEFLDNRNEKWISNIEKHISSKPTFIAFGAGHLGGNKGIVSLLRKKGYVITPIKL